MLTPLNRATDRRRAPSGGRTSPEEHTMHIEVVGAYGRTYRTLKDMRQDWNQGLDFRMTTGPYINCNDAKAHGVVGVVGRYGKDNTRVGTLL